MKNGIGKRINNRLVLLAGRLFFGIVTLVLVLNVAGHAVAQTWTELAPIGSPPDPVFAPKPIHYDAANNRLIAFFPGNPPHGGFGNQVWVLTNANGLGGTPTWIALQPTGIPPFSNANESVVYDTLNNRLIVYGGCFANCSPALADVFVLSHANGLGGTPVWTQSTVTNPQARAEHSAVYDAATDRIIAFAGHLAFFGTDHNDTRILSNANGLLSPSTWSTLSPAGGPPAIRASHRAIYDAANNRMTIFSGYNLIHTCCPYIISDYNDVWVLSNANGQGGIPTWTQIAPLGGLPQSRAAHSTVYDATNNRALVFGGSAWNNTTQASTVFGDLWQLSSANGLGGTPVWTQLAQSGALPGPRFYHTAAFDTANQRMIVLGGRDETATPSNRVWVLDLAQAGVEVCDGMDNNGNGAVDEGFPDADGDGIANCVDTNPTPTPTPTPEPTPTPIACNGLPVTILGTPGNDTITGTPGDDVIHGLGGRDHIRGLGGNDVICGGDGRDIIFGGSGDDRILGEAGPDCLMGGGANDTLLGGSEMDSLYGHEGDDAMDGGAHQDRCKGGPGVDSAVACESIQEVP